MCFVFLGIDLCLDLDFFVLNFPVSQEGSKEEKNEPVLSTSIGSNLGGSLHLYDVVYVGFASTTSSVSISEFS